MFQPVANKALIDIFQHREVDQQNQHGKPSF